MWPKSSRHTACHFPAIPVSEIAPEYMNFPDKKKKTEPKNNAEAIPAKED